MNKKINILLVDDHKLIRDGIKSIMNTSKRISVVGDCNNGKEAIDFLKGKGKKVDVILMDITMPELNGIDATEIITKLYPKIKILALTMHIEESYLMKMINAGALGYILKDSTRNKLIEAIETVYKNEKYYSSEVSMKLINHLFKEEKETESDLSQRELQILKSISNGSTNREIAKQLDISNRTVETHRRNIIRKLNVKNTAELINHAVSEGLIKV
ncbi:MAG: response regulator transcription factor [Vicingus serpentipes]|nr:response regulator transcription factor [Vicingus serpentipes]